MVNEVTLIGNVGKDPEIKIFDWGKVAKFSLATSRSWKNKDGEKVTETQWHNIVIKSNLADVVEKWVKKGSKLYLKGEINYRSWEDKEGNKKYMTEIICFNMQMLDSKAETLKKDEEIKAETLNNEPPPPGPDSITANDNFMDTDDIPFP